MKDIDLLILNVDMAQADQAKKKLEGATQTVHGRLSECYQWLLVPGQAVGELIMSKAKYVAFKALDPFFEVVQQGLSEFVDGDHYFDTIADDALFEFLYYFPGWPKAIHGRANLMAAYAGYGENIVLHRGDGLTR